MISRTTILGLTAAITILLSASPGGAQPTVGAGTKIQQGEARITARSDQYFFDIIKHGGSPIGRPGMPAFGSTLSDEDITLLVQYVRKRAAR